MKKTILIILSLVMLCSCSGEAQSSDLLARMSQKLDLPASYTLYTSSAAQGDGYLSDSDMALIYPDGTDVRTLCSDYAILISRAQIPYEIHLLHSRSRAGVAELCTALQKRKDMIQLRKNESFAAGYREATEGARVICSGNYAILLITPDSENAERILRDVWK